MRHVLLRFVRRLREAGVDVSPAETMDALAAVAVAGIEREVLREALAATLVKDERDRPVYDALFETTFPLVGERDGDRGRRARRRTATRGLVSDGGGTPRPGASGTSGSGGQPGNERGRVAGGRPEVSERRPVMPAAVLRVAEDEPRHAGLRVVPAAATADRRSATRRARRLALLQMPFATMTAQEVAEAREVAAALGVRLRGRLARRERLARRGRVDLRRTLRAATGTGGIPLRLRRRGRQPGRPDLLALCDLSGSVAAASELLLALLAPVHDWFRRVETFAFVDRLCPVVIERGHVVPGGHLDLYARSDFGRVLADLWPAHALRIGPRTLVLVLGDARNNRRPPRRDLWREIRARAGRVVWLVPEPRSRWNTGDSALGLYAPACDAVVECLDLATLAAAVRRLF